MICYGSRMSDEALRSKALFGNRHLLGVAARIASGSPQFVARDLEVGMGLPPGTVYRTLQALTRAGLIERLSRGPGEREQRYRRLKHLFWRAASELHDEIVGASVDAKAS